MTASSRRWSPRWPPFVKPRTAFVTVLPLVGMAPAVVMVAAGDASLFVSRGESRNMTRPQHIIGVFPRAVDAMRNCRGKPATCCVKE
jgi:hypothetical protein